MKKRERRADRAGLGVLVALSALALGPVLVHRGVVLVGDMTFVPHQPWKPAWLGLDGSVPRAVPADAFVSVLSSVVPGDLLQKAVLLAVLVLAGLGVVRLLVALAPKVGRVAGLSGAALYLWNPYVQERLAIGHWGLLVSYAALPWVLLTAEGLRRGRERSWHRLACWLAIAAIGSPTGGLMAGLLALALTAGHRWRPGVQVVLTTAVVNLPWLVPGLLANGIGTDAGGVRAFAARADTPLGVVGSLLTFGGIWKQSIVAGERSAWLLVLVALGVTLSGLAALVSASRSPRTGSVAPTGLISPEVARRLLMVAATGFAFAVVPSTGPGASLVASLVDHVPGAGILRDSQKWVALFALVSAVGVALAADRLVRAAVRRGLSGRAVGGALVLVPVVVLPSMAWGLAGQFEPVHIPSDWAAAARVLDDVPADQQRTVVLPFSTYQRFGWNGQRAALDPAIRFFPGQIVTNDRLVIDSHDEVAGDSAASARIAAAAAGGRPLEPVLVAEGIRFVLLERTAAGASASMLPAGGTVVHEGPEITLVDLGGTARSEHARHPWMVVMGDLAALLVTLGAATFLAVRRLMRKPVVIG